MPTHEQQPIKLFDIREFVKQKKEEKRNELFGGGANPFGGGNPFANPSPFGNNSSDPFGMMGQPKTDNPFGPSTSPNSFSPFGGIPNSIGTNNNNLDNEPLNIDDMIKKIDERIAELEKEEKADKLAKENEALASSKDLVENKQTEKPNIVFPTNKIDFTNFESVKQNNVTESIDIMDDFMEDLSDEPETIEPKVEIIKENYIKPENKEIYVNKEEVNKILNEKDDEEDLFDEFFE